MVNNLKEHGTVFNMADDQSFVDDLLNADFDALEVGEDDADSSSDDSFEDEN